MKPRILVEISDNGGAARGFWSWLGDLDGAYYVAEIRRIGKQLVKYGRVYVSAADAKMFKDIARCAGYWTAERPFLTFREEKV